jgi:hypothetical protein
MSCWPSLLEDGEAGEEEGGSGRLCGKAIWEGTKRVRSRMRLDQDKLVEYQTEGPGDVSKVAIGNGQDPVDG